MDIKRAWIRLLDRAGIEDLWIHDLRRTLATWMANHGASAWEIANQLAHKDRQSTEHYVHLDPARSRPQLQKVTRLLNQSQENVLQ